MGADTVSGTTATYTGDVQLGDNAADTLTIYAGTTTSGNPNFDWSGSTGTFKTSTGANTLSGNTTVTGAKTFDVGTGLTTLGGNLDVTGDVDVNAKFTVVAASGNTAVLGTLDVTGISTLTGDVACQGALTVTGTTTLNGNLVLGDAAADTLTITATPTVAENAIFQKNIDITGALTVTGATTCDGALVANGNTTLGNAATDTVQFNADIGSSVAFDAGAFDFDMSLSTGAFDFPTGAITMPGALTLTANVDMDFVAAERMEITSSGHTGAVDALIVDMTSSDAGVIRGITVLQNAASTQLLDVGILVDNLDAASAVTDAFSATVSGAMADGVVNAFNGGDANITNALAIGANAITGTNFSVTGAGVITSVGITNGTTVIGTSGVVDIIPTGATAIDLLDITRSDTATAGNAIDIEMGSAVVGGHAIDITMDGSTGNAINADGDISTSSDLITTGTGALTIAGVASLNNFVDITPAGATAADLVDITRSATATAGNAVDIDMGVAVVAGDAINITMSGSTGSAIDADGAITTSDNISTTGTGTITSAGLLTGNGGLTVDGDIGTTLTGTEQIAITSDTHTGGVDVLSIDVTASNAGVIRGITVLQNAAATQILDIGILVDNTDATQAITDAFSATCSGAMAAGVVNAFNASDANITNALVAGANDLSGTSWDIAGATGAITCVGLDAGVGAIANTGGASGTSWSITDAGTITGATITDGAFSVNAGAVTGVTTLDMTGNLTVAGTVDTVDIAGHVHDTYSAQAFTGVGVIGGGVTRYLGPNSIVYNAADTIFWVAPTACTIEAMYVYVGTAPGGAVDCDFYVDLNTAQQTMTVQLSAGETNGNTVANPVSVAAGDRISVKIVEGGGGATADVNVGLRITTPSAVPS